MNENEFKKQLKRGLGSAIIELKKAPDKSIYMDIVLWGCLNDIIFDWQTEGTKGDYLYHAIMQFDDPDYFLDFIVDKYQERNRHSLAVALEVLLWNFALDGSERAKRAISDKMLDLVQKLPKRRTFSRVYCERELLESTMQSMIGNGGYREFKKCVELMGSMVKRHGSDDCIAYDCFMSSAESKFDEDRIKAFFDKEILKQTDAATFALAYRQSEARYAKASEERKESAHLTADELYKLVQSAAKEDNPRYKLIGVALRFARKASSDELLEVARLTINEKNESVKALCLLVFTRIDFPMDISHLLEYVNSSNKYLAEISVEVLSRFKDDRVHDLAFELLQNGDDRAFALFVNNFRRKDAVLICQNVLKMKNVPHYVQMSIRDVLRSFKSPINKETLIHIYRNGDCAFCRSDVVRTMHKSGCLTDEILMECLYDSYDETRIFAERIRKKRGIILD